MRPPPIWSSEPTRLVLSPPDVKHAGHGRGALDLAVFRGRWDATEGTFRPPYFHRNSAIEFNAVVKTPRTEGPYVAGTCTYTPYLSPHGVSAESVAGERMRSSDAPTRHSDAELWIQFESTYSLRLAPSTVDSPDRDASYLARFRGLASAKLD